MEDQRNWTDASFKTYCTPLGLPFPVEVKAGQRIRQAIKLSLKGDRPIPVGPTVQPIPRLTLDSAAAMPLPKLGLGLAGHGQPLSQAELNRLKGLNLAHLRLDLTPSRAGYAHRLAQATAEAKALGASLEIALFLSDLSEAAEAELKEVAAQLAALKPPVSTWLLFQQAGKMTDPAMVQLARTQLARYSPGALFGGGTDAYFTELNRARPTLAGLDLVSYSLNPQVHAFDNASLVETLPAQAATVASARHFTADRPLAISPVTLLPRFNPNATAPEPEPGPEQLPPPVDRRQMSLFGAGWTVGSLGHLCRSGLHSITYYETTGWRGVMEREAGSPLPELFPSLPEAVFPLYHVLAEVGDFAGGESLALPSSAPLLVEGLALRSPLAQGQGPEIVLLVANLSPQRQEVRLENVGHLVWVRPLDETTAWEAMQKPGSFRAQPGQAHQTDSGRFQLALPPYGLARVRFWEY